MRTFLTGVTLAVLMAAPLQAADWRDASTQVRPGAFVGARLQLSTGAEERPRASLTVAPTQSRISGNGMIRTRIGEGIALNLTGERKPTVTLAGVRADSAVRRDRRPDQAKAGISTGGWIAIGVGTAVIAGGVAFALWVDAVNDSGD